MPKTHHHHDYLASSAYHIDDALNHRRRPSHSSLHVPMITFRNVDSGVAWNIFLPSVARDNDQLMTAKS
jgi:hypothetical protein